MGTQVAAARRWAESNVAAATALGLLAIVVLVIIGKWLMITALILAVPFALWWAIDRAQHRTPAPVVPPVSPTTGRVDPRRTPPPRTARARGATLPGEVQVTVTREQDHQDVLARHHRARSTAPTQAVAELVSGVVSTGKHQGAYAVEVRLGGERVGELTAAMSSRYSHVVLGAESRGDPARATAAISSGGRGLQVDLLMPKAS